MSAWGKWVRENPDLFRFGTVAHHQLGEITRDDGDVFVIDREDADNFYGAWLTGFGFVNVRFPKATTRELTEAELADLAEGSVVIA